MTTLTKERPILFSGEMVRQILAGNKTQSRRVVKPQPYSRVKTSEVDVDGYIHWEGDDGGVHIGGKPCPYGKPGDRLWVRETWRLFAADYPRHVKVEYKDGHCAAMVPAAWPVTVSTRWRPSIHMPRWASRITLEVTEVRVERVQDISFPDCRAEGMYENYHEHVADCKEPDCDGNHYGEKYHFMRTWDSINGKKYPWESNPWVWAITFQRVKP